MDLSTITQKLGIQGELTTDQRQGIVDAIGAILQSRMGGGGLPDKLLQKLADLGADLNMDMEVDPQLLQPSQKKNPPPNPTDVDYDINDPDNLLKPNPETETSKKEGPQDPRGPQDPQDSQDPQGPQGPDSQPGDENQSGSSKGGSGDDDGASENKKQSDSSETETDSDFENDFIDDDLIDGFDDKEKAEANKARPRRIAASRTKNLGNEALKSAGSDPKKQSQANRLRKALDRLSELESLSDEELNKISGDDFQQRLNEVTDAASALDPKIHVETDAQYRARVKEIKDDFADKKTQLELGNEVKQNANPTSGIQASQQTKDGYQNVGKYKTLADFKVNFYKAIKDQVQEVEERSQSWSAINRRYDGTGLIVRGNKNEKLPVDLIPSVDVYVDCSGSWGDADIEIGQVAVNQLMEFERKKQVKINLIYFANNLHDNMKAARRECCTGAWNQILQNIKQNNIKNVVLITDNDMHYDAASGPRLVVPGCVWFIWRNGKASSEIVNHLVGKRGNFQYAFKGVSEW